MNEKPLYTTIIHEVRIEIKISLIEYCVADIITKLMGNPKSKVPGWYYGRQDYLANIIGTSEKTIQRTYKALIKKLLLEKGEGTGFMRTTSKWYNLAYLSKGQNVPLLDKLSKSADKMSVRVVDKMSDNNLTRDNNKDMSISHSNGVAVNELINLFRNINPSYRKFFKNTTQRAAIERLIKQFGQENIAKVIKKLPETNQQKYAPIITTPSQLEDKFAALTFFLKKESGKVGYIEL